MPEELRAQVQALQNAGVATADPAEREKVYFELQQLYYDEVPAITLAQNVGRHYEQCWVKDWYYNPLLGSNFYFYAYDLAR